MIGGISIWQLLILLAIVVLVFGTKRIRNLGGDLGSALKDFRGAMKSGEDDESHKKTSQDARAHSGDSSSDSRVIDQEPTRSEDADRPAASRSDEKTPSEDRQP